MRPNPNLLKQMQKNLAKAQEELERETVEASVGGGAITVTMNGHMKVLSVQISKEVVDPDDVDMLQDLVTTALNDAITKAQDLQAKRMSAVTGMRIPGLF